MSLDIVYHEFENGDFENELVGYEKTDATGFTAEIVTDTVHGRTNALHLKADSTATAGITNHMLWQTVAVEPNTAYKWTFYAKAGSETTAGTNTLVGVRSVYETELLPSNFTTETGEIATDRALQSSKRSITVANNWHQGIRNTDDWAEYTVTFATGDATTVLLTFNLFAAGREIWIDNMTLAKAEELEVQIANNDFEVAVTDGALEGFGVSGIPTVLETVLDGENNVLHISSGEQGGTGAIYQKIIVMPNTDYVWSFKLKEMNVQEDSRSVISVFGADGTNLVNENFSYSEIGSCTSWNTSWYATTDSQGWATFYFKFNSGDNCQVQFTHNAWTTARDTYIDDWSVVAIDDIVVGDGDGDGTLAAGDLVVLRQRLLNIPNTIDELSADINKDKALNLKDLVVLKKATVAK